MSSTTTWEQSPWQPYVATGWTSLQVKRRFAIKLGKMLQNEPSSVLDSEVPYLKAQHVQWSGIRLVELPTMWASARDIAELSLTPGDLLVCEGGKSVALQFLARNFQRTVSFRMLFTEYAPDKGMRQGSCPIFFGMLQHKGGSTCSATDRRSRTSLLTSSVKCG